MRCFPILRDPVFTHVGRVQTTINKGGGQSSHKPRREATLLCSSSSRPPGHVGGSYKPCLPRGRTLFSSLILKHCPLSSPSIGVMCARVLGPGVGLKLRNPSRLCHCPWPGLLAAGHFKLSSFILATVWSGGRKDPCRPHDQHRERVCAWTGPPGRSS